MVGRRGATGKHCPAKGHCHAAKQVTGSWGGVRGAAAILNGLADVGDGTDGVLSRLSHQRGRSPSRKSGMLRGWLQAFSAHQLGGHGQVLFGQPERW